MDISPSYLINDDGSMTMRDRDRVPYLHAKPFVPHALSQSVSQPQAFGITKNLFTLSFFPSSNLVLTPRRLRFTHILRPQELLHLPLIHTIHSRILLLAHLLLNLFTLLSTQSHSRQNRLR